MGKPAPAQNSQPVQQPLPTYNPQPPIASPGIPSQPPQMLPPPIFVPRYPSYPHYPSQNPSFPPQIPNYPYQPQRNDDYILTFDWAPKTNGINNLASSKGIVKIGNQKVADFSADDGNPKVRHVEINIPLQNGENSISFEGAGNNDGHGATVGNVMIRRRDSSQNLLVNGDFSSTYVTPGTWKFVSNGIKGWSVDLAELGECRLYNNDWKGGQCIELDSTSNQIYTQYFVVSKC